MFNTKYVPTGHLPKGDKIPSPAKAAAGRRNIKYKLKGFTLIELLIYTGISIVVGGLTVGTLLTVTRINQNASATAEVSGQMNFVLQRLQQLVSESSNIDIDAGVATSSIKLRMQDSTKDPTCISLVDGVIKIAEGPGSPDPNSCNSETSDLTNSKVVVNILNFKKLIQYPGHDTLTLDMTMTYNSDNPNTQVSRSVSSATGRVSTATFDSNLLPNTDNEYEIGFIGQRWKNISISNLLNVGPLSVDPTNGMQNGSIYYNAASSSFRGYNDGFWADLQVISPWITSSTAIYYDIGNVGIGTMSPNASLDLGIKTDGIVLPTGTTAQRPGSPSMGSLRYNSTLSKLEFYNGTAWRTYSSLIDSDFSATGGTITEAGGYRIHTFTASGTLTISGSGNVEVLVVAGGGSGGNSNTTNANGGGGGGGVVYSANYAVTAGGYPVVVGNGGAAVANATCARGNNGQDSTFGTLTARGGGGGGTTCGYYPASGGSGGGGATTYLRGASSTQESNSQGSKGYGNAGGSGAIDYTGAGGGGAGSAGVPGVTSRPPSGDGGRGYPSAISGTLKYYGGGGGGGANSSQRAGDGYDGGGRGFGTTSYYGYYYDYPVGVVNSVTGGSATLNAVPNTGGGGGAGSYWAANGGWTTGSGTGGSGIVIIRYRIADTANSSVSATGGTITEAGGYRIHTFTASGTLTISGSGNVEVLVVAGGGSGGNSNTTNANGGGGGGGVVYSANYAVTAGGYPVVVGNGGAAVANATCARGNNGQDSTFGTLTARGGGGGGTTCGYYPASGGSGGGSATVYLSGGASTQGGGGYGNAGGSGAIDYTGAGGGGAGSPGVPGDTSRPPSGNGGRGYPSAISGTLKYYAGGGGGGANSSQRAGDGYDGGGRGFGTTSYYAYNNYPVEVNATTRGSGTLNAIANTGGGGGAGSYWAANGGWTTGSGTGGSGIVIVRYRITPASSTFGGSGGTETQSGGYKIHTFTSSGAFTVTGSGNVEVLVVAGGGSGGNSNTTNANGGGGGGGVVHKSVYAVASSTYSVIVGRGGEAVPNAICGRGNNGEDSLFDTLVARGGGGGGTTCGYHGASGGSGGGGATVYLNGGASTQGGGGYGNAGGSGGVDYTGSGGGGASSTGVQAGATSPGGNGGRGYPSAISGTLNYYGGGGGGGGNSSQRAGDGYDGGGRGFGTTSYYAYNNYPVEVNATTRGSGTLNAIANTGGGGGAGSYWAANGGWTTGSGTGGSGIVIVRYPI